MEHERLSRLLGTLSTNKVARTPDCPDDHELAAAVDGILPDESMRQFVAHLADCNYCTAQTSLLRRLNQSPSEEQVGEFTLARARRLGKSSKRQVFRHVSRWACAAVIVLALSLLIKTNSIGPEVTDQVIPDSVPQAIEPRQSRNLNTGVLRPKILTPVNGVAIDPGSLVFNWTEIPGSLHYDVRIVSEDGDLVWQGRVSGTEMQLPGDLQLEHGSDYFFRVDAYLATAKSLNSRHVLFTVGGER